MLAVLLLAVASAAAAGPYTFVNIADTTGPFRSFAGGNVSLNAGGTVAFYAPLDAGGEGIFTRTGGAVTTVVDTSGQFSAFGAGIAINNGGTVAFRATLDAGGSGVFSIGGGGQTTIAQTGGQFSEVGTYVAVNSGGTVAFLGQLTAGGSGVFAGSGGSPVTLADSSGPLSGFGVASGAGVGLNDAGMAVFRAGLDAGGTGVFTGSGGTPTALATTQTVGAGFLSHPSINDSGTVVFTAVLSGADTPGDDSDDSAAIYKGTPGSLATVVDTTGKFKALGNSTINAGGTVLFLGVLDTGGFGYYTSDDLVNPVISFGDTLFASIVTGLDSVPGFNDAGQMAFTYELQDGRRGIARADLLRVAAAPVPGTFALLALGLAGVGYARRRHENR